MEDIPSPPFNRHSDKKHMYYPTLYREWVYSLLYLTGPMAELGVEETLHILVDRYIVFQLSQAQETQENSCE